MKKIGLYALCLMCLLLVGCGSNKTKEVGSLDNFQSACVTNSFSYENKLSEYQAQNITYITDAGKATLDDATIEMVIYDNDESASKTQEQHIASFMNIKSTGATAHKEKGKNYYKFTMVSNGYYMVSSRIDNTLVFSKTLLANKEKIESILNEINY